MILVLWYVDPKMMRPPQTNNSGIKNVSAHLNACEHGPNPIRFQEEKTGKSSLLYSFF